MGASAEKRPSRIFDFGALSDPEGSLLIINASECAEKGERRKGFFTSRTRPKEPFRIGIGMHHRIAAIPVCARANWLSLPFDAGVAAALPSRASS